MFPNKLKTSLRLGVYNFNYLRQNKLLPDHKFIKYIPTKSYKKQYKHPELLNNNGHIFYGDIKTLIKQYIPNYFVMENDYNGSENNLLFYDNLSYDKDMKDIIHLVNSVKSNDINFQFIIDHNKSDTITEFYNNSYHKHMIIKSLLYNNKLPSIIHTILLNQETQSIKSNSHHEFNNISFDIIYTSLKYENTKISQSSHSSISNKLIQNHIFNYKHHYTKDYESYKNGSLITYENLDYMGHYNYNNTNNIKYIDDYILNIKDGLIIQSDIDLYWKVEFISKLCDLSLNKNISIKIPTTITIDETADFINDLF
jgi:hypothetical protein